jgi:hypothetical protein
LGDVRIVPALCSTARLVVTSMPRKMEQIASFILEDVKVEVDSIEFIVGFDCKRENRIASFPVL